MKHLEDLAVDGRMILKWMLQKREGLNGFIWLMIGTGGRFSGAGK
jgi:hypothetical protein